MSRSVKSNYWPEAWLVPKGALTQAQERLRREQAVWKATIIKVNEVFELK